ncbi:MAG: hypothetical protein M9894_21640 [Planctomycetes bacterium]|nr:hypothetical protein [Planctomycetota bacterium]
MTDDAQQAARRRWDETGAAHDGRRYLALLWRAGEEVEALRVGLAIGAVHDERARLAAHVGHVPAREALGLGPPAALPLTAWAQRLFDWGQGAAVRAAVAAARGCLERAPDEGAAAALAAADAWLACPCPRHHAAAEARFNPLRAALPPWAWEAVTAAHCPPRACWHHVRALSAAAHVVGEQAVRGAARDALLAWALAAGDLAAPLERPSVALR